MTRCSASQRSKAGKDATTMAVRRALAGVMAFVLGLLALGVGRAHAIPITTTPPDPIFKISGNLSELVSPRAFESAHAHFFNVTRSNLGLTHIHYYVVRGTLINGTYQYRFQIRQPYATTHTGGIELAINETAHTELIEVGSVTPPSTQTPNSVPCCGGGGGGGGAHAAGWYVGWYDDAELKLNSLSTWISFDYDGTHVGSYTAWDNPYVWSDDPLGPWYIVNHSHWSGYQNSNTSAYSESTAKIENTGFCGGAATDSYYSPNEVIGYGNGDVGWNANPYASGACSGLIHFEWNWA